MKKKVISLIVLTLVLLSIISADSIDSEIKKATYHAEEYETGNINYAQLLLYLSSSKENLNEALGVVSKEDGGILKQEQLEPLLGEPQRKTKWVWVEGGNYETKLDYEVPIWEKIVFDGKKIQIRLNAFPSIFSKEIINEEFGKLENSEDIKENIKGELIKEKEERIKKFDFNEKGTALVYRLHFQVEFKKPDEQMDITGKIENIKVLAENFNSDSSSANAELLAKESVNTERAFESYLRQNHGNCEDFMKSIFGSENLRGTSKIYSQQFTVYEGENFEVIAKMEMCDECDWHWINVNIWFEGRGNFNPPQEVMESYESKEKFKNMEWEEIEIEASNLVGEMISSFEKGDYDSAMSYSRKLQSLNEGWNEKSNDLWRQVEEEFKTEEQSMTEQERQVFNENYGWIKREQEKRKRVNELSKINYEKRKQFYNNLFAIYDKEESYYEQTEFEKRLIQEFREFGEEICDNNVDDNNNQQIDCSDSQCGGKFCGKLISSEIFENETSEKIINLYCIAGTCQQKEEIFEIKNAVCGNHICESGEGSSENFTQLNESGYCPMDCSMCPVYEAIACNGKIIFSGNDENGCSLKPICLEENLSCVNNENCAQPLCGKAECVEGICTTSELSECKDEECVEGQEKIMQCLDKELISEICSNGLWKKIDSSCEGSSEEIIREEIVTEEIIGDDCTTINDCGGQNDVCSNGRCVAIPQSIEIINEAREEPMQKINEGNIENSENNIEETTTEFEQANQETETGVESESQNSEEQTIQETGEESEVQNQGSEVQNQGSESTVTGGIIFNFIRGIGKITGGVITGFISEEEGNIENSEETNSQSENEVKNIVVEESSSEGSDVSENIVSGNENTEVKNENPEMNKEEFVEKKDFENDNGERDNEREEENRKEDCESRCSRECYDMKIRPCVEKCVKEKCGDNWDCNVDDVTKECESNCKSEIDVKTCEDTCQDKCLKGENTWEEPEREKQKEEKGVFTAGGGCRVSQGQSEGFIWFGGWGEPFDEVQPLKQKYYNGGQADWCKWDFENLKKQRTEFETSFNQEFVTWFFEKYMASSAEDWEQHVSGIFELYWRDVDISRELSNRMNCLGKKELDFEPNLINVNYETDYGKVEFWEELKIVKMPELDEEVEVITPYMKIWIFPPKEFIKYELKKSMENHEFPGSPEDKMERKNQEGPTEEEKKMLKQDEKFMKKIKEISEKYEGNFEGVVQFKDYESNEIIFNLYIQVNENDIFTMEPMLPEEIKEKDATIEIDFAPIYDMIYETEKDMRGAKIESPPWDNKGLQPVEKIKEIKNGIEMYFKVRKIMNSAKVYPEEAQEDVDLLFKTFFKMMMQEGDNKDGNQENIEEEGENTDGKNKEFLSTTGEAISK